MGEGRHRREADVLGADDHRPVARPSRRAGGRAAAGSRWSSRRPGAIPGTSRAERGRSRQPVARTTAGGSISSRPPGPVSFRPRSPSQSVTIVSAQDLDPRLRGQLAVALRVARPARRRCAGRAARSRCDRSAGGSRRPRARARSRSPGETPSPRSSIAAANPDGPPPTTTGPSAIAIVASRSSRGDLRAAEEPLAAAHQRPGAAAQPVEVDGRDRAPPARASISPRVTRSQKQTIRP